MEGKCNGAAVTAWGCWRRWAGRGILRPGRSGVSNGKVAEVSDAKLQRLRENIRTVFMGHARVVDLLLVGLLARGHVLIEDVPGVGKTILARSLAKSIDCRFVRIQLTPDLLPSDLLGVSIYNATTREFDFKPGPIFANIVLADEVNRTTPRTQSALLEAMAEEQVSVDSRTIALERPFMVVATQNPFEFEGTYYLPENQLDRFLLRISLGYPERSAEQKILLTQPGRFTIDTLKPVLTGAEVVELQDMCPKVRIEQGVIEYVLDLIEATRTDDQLHLGVSPRGGLALTTACQANAVLSGRDYVTPDDVKQLFLPVCSHRVISKTYLSNGDANSTGRILQGILDRVAAPR
jgi:MoxR-like ATPase